MGPSVEMATGLTALQHVQKREEKTSIAPEFAIIRMRDGPW